MRLLLTQSNNMKKQITLFIAFAAFSLTAMAQQYEVPTNYSFDTKADYKMYEPQIIATTDWLQRTAWKDQRDKRRQARLFFLSWVKGAPVNVGIGQTVTDLSDKNPELAFTYMTQYAKYSLLHKDDFDKNKANLSALKSMIDKYTMDPSRQKDDEVEKLIQIDKDGKLERWVSTDFK